MDYTPNTAEHLAYKERINEVITSNTAVVEYSFDLQAQQWCQFVLQVIVPFVCTLKAEHSSRKYTIANVDFNY